MLKKFPQILSKLNVIINILLFTETICYIFFTNCTLYILSRNFNSSDAASTFASVYRICQPSRTESLSPKVIGAHALTGRGKTMIHRAFH